MKKRTKKDKSLGDEIMESLDEVLESPSSLITYKISVDIKQLRKSLGMTQKEFAENYGFNIETLRKWEQGTYEPDKAVTSYLSCISENPLTIKEILSKRSF